jgi:hypothetical protein
MPPIAPDEPSQPREPTPETPYLQNTPPETPAATKTAWATVTRYREGDTLPDGSVITQARDGVLTLRRE